VLPVISEIVSGAKINKQGKKQGNPGALALPSTQSRPNESHSSAKRRPKDDGRCRSPFARDLPLD
jgi:hypothetical protein